MKALFLINLVIFVIIFTPCKCQEVKNGLEVKKEKNKDGSTSATYKEIVHSPPPMTNLKSKNGRPIEFMGSDFDSRKKVNDIEGSLFTSAEIEYLDKFGCIAHCRISTNDGKIVEIYFYFSKGDPDVSTKKLSDFARQIREQITFSLHFSTEIKQHGYINQSFPVFRSLAIPERKK